MRARSICLLVTTVVVALPACGGRAQPSTRATSATTAPRSSAPAALHPAARNATSLQAKLTPTSIWTIDPLEPADGAWYPGLLVTETDPDSSKVLGSRRITTEDLLAAAPDLVLVRGESTFEGPAPPLGNLTWDAVAGRTLALHTPEHIIGIDADTGRIHTLPVPPAGTLGPPGAGPVSGALGDAFMVVIGGVVSRIDFEREAITQVARVDVPDPQAKFGPDAIWIWGGDPSTIVRVDADGSTHRLDQFDGKVIFSELYPGTGLLWAIVVDAGVDPQVARSPELDPTHPPQVVGLDRDDGHRVVVVPPQPSQGHVLVAFRDGLFAATTDPTRWRWVDNAGKVTDLTPRPDLTLLGAAGERIAYTTAAGEVGTIAVADLLAAGNP